MNIKLSISALFVSMVLPCLASQEDTLEEFFRYTKVEQQLELMLKQQDTHKYSERSIRGVIEMCQDSHWREESVEFLKLKGLDVFKYKQVLLIEWGGGGLPCRAVYIPLQEQENLAYYFYLMYDGKDFSLKFKHKSCDKDSLPTIDFIIKMMKDGYQGDTSRTALGAQTRIATLIEDGVETKRVIIHGSAPKRGVSAGRGATNISLEFKEFYAAMTDLFNLYQIPIESGS